MGLGVSNHTQGGRRGGGRRAGLGQSWNVGVHTGLTDCAQCGRLGLSGCLRWGGGGGQTGPRGAAGLGGRACFLLGSRRVSCFGATQARCPGGSWTHGTEAEERSQLKGVKVP